MWEQVSVVIPAYNEEEQLFETLFTLANSFSPKEIIGINDGSSDKTGEILEKFCTHTIQFNKNHGKGSALKAGWEKATGEIIVCLDADLGSSVREAYKLVEPLQNPDIDGVIGRLPSQKKGGFGVVKRYAQKIIYQETGQWFLAPLSGQRSFRKQWLSVLLSKTYYGYGVEVVMTIDLIKSGARIVERDVDMYHRELGKTLSGFWHRGKQWYHLSKTLRRAKT